MVVRTSDKTKEALASLESICKQLNHQFPFTYQFSDEEYQKLYKSEQIVEKLSELFCILTAIHRIAGTGHVYNRTAHPGIWHP